ncbi:uncharacterized protein LOC118144223 isoform X1 [Callithrix jacchus]
MLAPPDPALDSLQPPQHQLLLADGFPTPRSCLPACILAASTGPAFPSQWLIGAQCFPYSGSLEPSAFLTVAHWSPVLSLQWLIGAQRFPHSGSLEPSASLTVAHWGPARACGKPLRTQLSPHSCLESRLRRSLAGVFLSPARLSQTLPGQLLPPGGLSRSKASSLGLASPGPASARARPIPGPASAFQWTLQAQLVESPWPLLRPSSCLCGSLYPQAPPPVSPWPHGAKLMPPGGPPGPNIGLLASSLGPERLQLRHEAELGLPAGDALGVLGPDLHLHQEERTIMRRQCGSSCVVDALPISPCREAGLHRRHHPPERGLSGARDLGLRSQQEEPRRLTITLLNPFRHSQVASASASTGHSPASSRMPWCGAPAPSTVRSGWV